MTELGFACALCARENPLMPQCHAATQVGALWVCGGHVDAAFEMHMDRTLRTDVVEQMTERLAEVSFNAAEKATQSPAADSTPVTAATEAHGETTEAQEGRHLYDDRAGGIWSHPGERKDCQMPDCTSAEATR